MHAARLEPWYVTGLLEGLGTFTFSRTGVCSMVLVFGAKVGDKDEPLLRDLQSFFGVGSIYTVRPRRDASAGNHRASSYYRVCQQDDLLEVTRHFDRFPLRGGKREAYTIWREMVLLKSEFFRRPPVTRLDELALKLSAASRRPRHRSASR